MILRHSWNQITLLHVYHHASVFLIWWFNVKYYPGGEGEILFEKNVLISDLAYFPPLFNSFVHVCMYSYYFLATLQIKAWWKQYLTMLQIAQLGSFVLQGVSLLLVTSEKEFQLMSAINGMYALTLLLLFVDFYRKSYSSRSANPRQDKEKKRE
jgi:hypothetical protein